MGLLTPSINIYPCDHNLTTLHDHHHRNSQLSCYITSSQSPSHPVQNWPVAVALKASAHIHESLSAVSKAYRDRFPVTIPLVWCSIEEWYLKVHFHSLGEQVLLPSLRDWLFSHLVRFAFASFASCKEIKDEFSYSEELACRRCRRYANFRDRETDNRDRAMSTFSEWCEAEFMECVGHSSNLYLARY